MKKILLITLIVLTVLVISGCCSIPNLNLGTGAKGTPTVMPTTIATQTPTNALTLTPTPTTTASATATGRAPGLTFDGTWDTDYGVMVVTQDGNMANGTYAEQGGMLSGTVTGNTLTGTWTEPPTRLPPDDAGDFVFTLSQDGHTFTGKWRYGHSIDPLAEWDGSWDGTRTV